MKKWTTAAFLVGAAVLACHSSFGQAVDNDLYFGFQNQAGSGTEDYIINLGAASGIVGGSSPVNLSSDFSMSLYDDVLGSSSSVQGGVIGAANTGNPSDVFLTQLRSGGAGNSLVAGSSVTATLSKSGDNLTFSDLGSLYSPAADTGGLDTGKSWENLVDPANSTGTFQSNTGLNPDSTVNTSSVLYEDLWETTSSASTGQRPYEYLGYFTLDLTGGSPSLTFTPAPEPSSIVISGAGGILLLLLRNRLWRRKA